MPTTSSPRAQELVQKVLDKWPDTGVLADAYSFLGLPSGLNADPLADLLLAFQEHVETMEDNAYYDAREADEKRDL